MAVVIALLILPLAAATDDVHVQAKLAVSGSTKFQGVANLTGQSSGLYYQPNPHDLSRLSINVDHGQLKILNAPLLRAGTTTGPTGPRYRYENLDTEVWANHTFTGRLTLVEALENASYRFLPLEEKEPIGLELNGSRAFSIKPPVKGTYLRVSDFLPDQDPNINRPLWPAQTSATLTEARPTNVSVAHNLFVLLFGGRFLVESEDGSQREVWTGRRVNESRTFHDPTSTSGVWYYDQVLVLISGDGIRVNLTGADSGRLYTSVQRLRGTWDGDLTFAGVSGHVDVDGQNLTPEPVLFQTIGRFEGGASYKGAEGTWSFEGPASFVGIDGVTIRGSRLPDIKQSILPIVGGVTALALIIAVLTPAGRAFLGGIFGRNQAEPLAHPTRQLLLRAIANNPGITRSQLAKTASINNFTARYHLRFLRRAGLLDIVHQGGKDAFMLNDASYRFPVESPAANEPPKPTQNSTTSHRKTAAEIVASLNHPVRQLMRQGLESAGPKNYEGLCKTWATLGVPQPWPSPSQVSRHGAVLEKAGVLNRERRGREIVWSLRVDLVGIRDNQVHRSLSDRRAKMIYELVAAQSGLSRDEIVEAYARRYPMRPASTVDEILLRLELTGLVKKDAARGTFAAA